MGRKEIIEQIKKLALSNDDKEGVLKETVRILKENL